MSHPTLTPHSYFDLVEMLPQPGCAICNLLLPLAERQLQSLLYDGATDPGIHQAIRARRGLCSTHAEQVTHYLGNAQTITIFYHAAVDEVVRLLGEMPDEVPPVTARRRIATLLGGNHPGVGLAGSLAPAAPCLVCHALDSAESLYAEVMATQLDDPRLSEAYQQSQGLCLPHLQRVLSLAADPAIIAALIATQRRLWAQLRDDLAAFIAKADYRFTYDDKGQEGDSWLRAVRQMHGPDRLFGPDPRPGV
jgi:hypothetical protein